MDNWKDLTYWQSGEYQVVKERLRDLKKTNVHCSPNSNIFRSLSLLKPKDTKVVILGQDPYPSLRYSTGVSFSIPKDIPKNLYPPTLVNLFTEYTKDLGYPEPSSGNLEQWSSEGVLLWNVIPTCTEGKSLSHDWLEWWPLTEEILRSLSNQGVCFVFLGAVARRSNFVNSVSGLSYTLEYSHPSPRGSLNSRTPFIGSRMFSTINSKIAEPINWRLP